MTEGEAVLEILKRREQKEKDARKQEGCVCLSNSLSSRSNLEDEPIWAMRLFIQTGGSTYHYRVEMRLSSI